MEKLTEIEQRIFERKRNLIRNRIKVLHHLSPIVGLIIDDGLSKIIKSNNYDFISTMYVDFIEDKVNFHKNFSGDEKFETKYSIYYKFFHFKDEEDFYNKMLLFTRYLLQNINKYSYAIAGSNVYFKKDVRKDNKRIIELKDFVKDAIGKYEVGIYHYAYASSLEKLMAYIIGTPELLNNRILCESLIMNFKANFDEYYDQFMMNTIEGYKSSVIKEQFFSPKQYVLEYHNKPIKKSIE